MSERLLEATGLTMTYGEENVLRGIDLDIGDGITVIMGESGSGKSTLMNCLATTESATGGSVLFGGVDLLLKRPKELARLRADRMGFVFQSSGLLGGLTVAENIQLPHQANKTNVDPDYAMEVSVGLRIDRLLAKRPGEISGGEAQRVAIARALVHKPDIVFADEPTAALDAHNRSNVYKGLRSVSDLFGTTVVVVAHDDYATSGSYADRVVTLSDGMIDSVVSRGD